MSIETGGTYDDPRIRRQPFELNRVQPREYALAGGHPNVPQPTKPSSGDQLTSTPSPWSLPLQDHSQTPGPPLGSLDADGDPGRHFEALSRARFEGPGRLHQESPRGRLLCLPIEVVKGRRRRRPGGPHGRAKSFPARLQLSAIEGCAQDVRHLQQRVGLEGQGRQEIRVDDVIQIEAFAPDRPGGESWSPLGARLQHVLPHRQALAAGVAVLSEPSPEELEQHGEGGAKEFQIVAVPVDLPGQRGEPRRAEPPRPLPSRARPAVDRPIGDCRRQERVHHAPSQLGRGVQNLRCDVLGCPHVGAAPIELVVAAIPRRRMALIGSARTDDRWVRQVTGWTKEGSQRGLLAPGQRRVPGGISCFDVHPAGVDSFQPSDLGVPRARRNRPRRVE